MERRLILVTGSPRSGTTAVGRNLARPLSASYLYEPFNVMAGLNDIKAQFEIIGARSFSGEKLDDIVGLIRSLQLPAWKAPIKDSDDIARRLIKHTVGGLGRQSYLRCRANPFLKTIVWKDPLAAFVAGEVARRHGVPVLVTVRPAEAVIASFRRMNWKPDARALLAAFQQVGWSDQGLRRLDWRLDNPVIAAAVIWCLVYTKLIEWAVAGSDLKFIWIQDIIDNPIAMYQQLYRTYDLSWTSKIETAIRKEYRGNQKSERPLPRKLHIKKRSMQEINNYGLSMLTNEEKSIIHDFTAPITTELLKKCRSKYAHCDPTERTSSEEGSCVFMDGAGTSTAVPG